MKHTKNELKLFQSYDLELKIEKTSLRLKEAIRNYEIYVSFSGGKDSEVAVDLTAKIMSEMGYKTLHVVNINTGLEYLSVQQFCKPFCESVAQKYGINIILDTVYPKMTFRKVIETYGYPIISKEISQCVSEARKGLKNPGKYTSQINKMNGTKTDKNGDLSPYNYPQYKYLLNAPFNISHLCCQKTKKDPAITYEHETGRIPIIATTAEESRLRQSSWLKYGCNAFEGKRPHSAPFSFWTNQDMLQYIHRNRLPIAEAYGEIHPVVPNAMQGQANLFDQMDYDGCTLHTTECPRTGCIYCLFGIAQDKDRILRLQHLEPKRADYVLRGGRFDENGLWEPNQNGLGYWFILDYLKNQGIEIPYLNAERYRTQFMEDLIMETKQNEQIIQAEQDTQNEQTNQSTQNKPTEQIQISEEVDRNFDLIKKNIDFCQEKGIPEALEKGGKYFKNFSKLVATTVAIEIEHLKETLNNLFPYRPNSEEGKRLAQIIQDVIENSRERFTEATRAADEATVKAEFINTTKTYAEHYIDFMLTRA